jgi:transposase
MKINETIGIDVSKSVIDVCIYTLGILNQFENSKSGFKKMLLWIFKNTNYNKKEFLFVFEHTGMYSDNLGVFLDSQNYHFCIVPGLEIKKSMGITRGKDDQVDAKRIALYAYRLRDELIPSKLPSKDISTLKSLNSLRLKLVKQRAGYKSTLKEQKAVYSKKDFKTIFEVQQKMIVILTKEIQKLETKMQQIIKVNETLSTNYNLTISVKGIGPQTAFTILIYTDNFTKFKTWRKFASYCGIAPFPYQSGSSIKGRTKVSHLANKKLKSILNMCAVSSIQHNPEMKLFYQRRIESGKNKMSTINIIRNKLISRVFATVKRQTPYVDIMKFAA